MKLAASLAAVAAVSIAIALKSFTESEIPTELASEKSIPVVCADEEVKKKIRQIMQTALDQALHDQIAHLYEIWLKDETGQPERARVGALKAVTAYIHASKALAKWDIMTC